MCNWRKWIWPGILATVLLTALAMLMKSGSIEQDLQAKALGDLSGTHSWAQVELDGRDLTLSGIAPTQEAADDALQIADNAYDVRIASSSVELPPIADPYQLSAVKGDGTITLSGSVPDDSVRAALVESAKSALGDGEVVDEMTLARGAPGGFAALAGFGISQLTDFTSGSSELQGTALSVKGEAPSVEIYEAVNSALSGDLPGGGSLASAEITAPTADNYTLTASKSASGIVLEGYVPSTAVRSEVVAAAESAGDGNAVTDNLQLALGAPEAFAGTATFAISQLSGMSSGTATLSASDLSVTGDAKTIADFDAINSALRNNLPQGVTLARDQVTSPAISPYTFAAEEGESGIVLTGYVPDEETRAALVAQAGQATSGTLTDRLETGPGAPDGFADLAGFGLNRLGEFSTGSVSLSDLSLSVRGTADSPQAYDAANAALSGAIPAGGNVVLSDITRSTVSPYTFSASSDDGILVLDGYVGSEAQKAEAVTYARTLAPNDRVIDRLVIANGAPDGVDWTAANRLAIKGASQLMKGKAAISDNAYTIEGMARTNSDFEAINTEMGASLPASLDLAKADIRRPIITPYVWSFENLENSAPALSGYVPDDGLSEAGIAQIQSRLGTGSEVANTLEIGAGAPNNFGAATSVAIQAASRLVNGKASITGTELMVSGEALSDQAAEQIRTNVENGLPPGFSGSHDISVRQVTLVPEVDADECQTLLTDSMKQNSILFETAKAVIKPDSFGLLDRLSFVVRRCPAVTVEIAGHTDSDGSDEYNQSLSEERANAVRSHLVQTGIFVGRLRAVGYGETQPIADNSTDEGKARNRRIEFTVVR